MRLDPDRPWLKRCVLAALLAAGSTLVAAQPVPPQGGTPPEPAPLPLPGPAPGAPVAEEAPPVNVAPPQPMVVPPISPKEVAPAPAPKATVTEKATQAPVRRARYDTAILQALDKVTAESLRFEAPIGRPIRYKSIVFTVKACERSAPDEAVEDSIAYLTIDSQPRPQPGKATPPPRQAFKGWMYASSPGLNPLEHPVYDAWLITCRTNAPAPAPVAAAVAPPPKVVAAAPVRTAPKPAVPAPKSAAPAAKAEPSPTPAPAAPPAASAAPAPADPSR